MSFRRPRIIVFFLFEGEERAFGKAPILLWHLRNPFNLLSTKMPVSTKLIDNKLCVNCYLRCKAIRRERPVEYSNRRSPGRRLEAARSPVIISSTYALQKDNLPLFRLQIKLAILLISLITTIIIIVFTRRY